MFNTKKPRGLYLMRVNTAYLAKKRVIGTFVGHCIQTNFQLNFSEGH